MPEIVEVKRLEDLDRYRLLWTSLLGQTDNATFFQSYEWLRSDYEANLRTNPRTLVVFSRGKPIGIVPLVQRKESSLLGSVSTVGLPQRDWCPCIGPIGPNPTATLVAGMKHLSRESKDWQNLNITIADPPADFDRMATALEVAALPTKVDERTSAGLINLPQTWNGYLLRRPRGFTERLGRLEQRAAGLRFGYLRVRPDSQARGDGNPHWGLFHNCLELARANWQGHTRCGALIVNGTSLEFLQRLHQVAAHSGCLDLNVLTVQEEPCAFFHNVHYNGHVQNICWSTNPEYDKYGIDRLLLSRMIHDSIRRSDQWIDIGRDGIGRWRPWTSRATRTCQFQHYRKMDARSQVLRVSRWMSDRIGRVTAKLGAL